jgi:ABC-type glycerol-3-phosphate transport system substrate-binding protein
MGISNMQPGYARHLAALGNRVRRACHYAAWLLPAMVLAWACSSSGCGLLNTPAPAETLVPRTPERTPTGVPLPTPTGTPVPAGAPDTLALWVTELVYPLKGGEAAQVLEQQVAAFEATHPGLTVQVWRKKPEGKGGMQDLLSKASAVAPDALPDLVALDTGLLADLSRKGLVVPLEGLVAEATQTDLYPFAIEAGTVDGHLVGLQFEVDNIEHAIYNPSKIAVPPLTWSEVLSSGATYIFPAAGQDGLVNDAFLIQYLSTGATLVDANGEPALDKQALTDVLTFYQTGIERGAILTDVLNYASVEACWPRYLQAEVTMTDITSNLYLTVRSGQVTAIPTRGGQATALSRGYAWALTTRDPSRQPLAVKLLEWLMHPANVAAWSQAAGRLPARRAAFEQMTRDAYVTFMYDQLEHAVPYGTSQTHQRIYRAMQTAIGDVLGKGVQPEAAAENVLQAVNQGRSP